MQYDTVIIKDLQALLLSGFATIEPMNKKTKSNLKRKVANFFGAVGYFWCSVLWFWTLLVYSSLINDFAHYVSPTVNQQAVKNQAVVGSSDITLPIIIVGVITVIMIALTIYILIKLPSTLARASKKVVNEATEGVMPLVLRAQNKKDTKRNRLKLSPRLNLILKTVLIAIPIILLVASQFLEKQILDFYLVIIISIWLVSFCLVFFVIQYISAWLLSVKRQELI